MNWLERLFVSKYLKGWLDKIPGNGFKTVLGLILVALGAVAQLKPEYAGIINWLVELLKPYSDAITDAGIISLVVGVIHKIAKYIGGKE